MEETAKHLVESVLPEVPLRQWVMTLPWKLRTPLGYDREAMAVFVRSFAQALSRRYKHVAKRVRAPSENELLRIAAEVSGKVMVRCGL